MLIADVPVVLIGKAAAARIPMRAVRLVAAALFAALGVYAWVRAGIIGDRRVARDASSPLARPR